MTSTRVPLAVAGSVAGVLLVQATASAMLSEAWAAVLPNGGVLPFPVLSFIENDVFRILAFGVGVWLSLKYIAPLSALDSWARTIGRGFIATLLGVVAVFVLAIIWEILSTVHISSYPFGYSLDPSIDTTALVPYGLLNVFNAIFVPSTEWFPVVVLAAVLAKAWLGGNRGRIADAATAPASRAGTPAGR